MPRVIKKNIQPILIIMLAITVVMLIFQNEIMAIVSPHQETRQDMILKHMSKSGQTVRLVDVGTLAEGDWRLFCILGPGVNPAKILPREASLSSQRLKFNALDRMTKEHEMTFVEIDSAGMPTMLVRPHNMDIVLHGSHSCVQVAKPTTFLPIGAKDFTFYR